MEFQRVNRTDPERIFLVVKNSWSTASLAANQWVSWDLITDRDGVAEGLRGLGDPAAAAMAELVRRSNS